MGQKVYCGHHHIKSTDRERNGCQHCEREGRRSQEIFADNSAPKDGSGLRSRPSMSVTVLQDCLSAMMAAGWWLQADRQAA